MRKLIIATSVIITVVIAALLAGSALFTSLAFATASAALAAAPGNTGQCSVSTAVSVPAGGPVQGYDAEQLGNAAAIMNAATALNLPGTAQIIGVMTALGESGLRVLNRGDAVGPDSRGLFQQRDNGAWGSYEDRMDPTISATNFFTRLAAIPGWEQMTPTAAAHAVQRNADPDHYTKFHAAAQSIVLSLGGGTGVGACATGSAALPLDPGYNMTSGYGPRVVPGAPNASRWHPAIDLATGSCQNPVYAMLPGTVTRSDTMSLSVQHPDGFTVSYLHMYKSERLVDVGAEVAAGQQIGAIGNVGAGTGQSSGCHLDIRMNVTGNTNPQVAALPESTVVPGYVNPEDFSRIFGLEICPPDSCRRTF